MRRTIGRTSEASVTIVPIASARSVLYLLISFSLLGSDIPALTHVHAVRSQTLEDSRESCFYGIRMNRPALGWSRRSFQARAVCVPRFS